MKTKIIALILIIALLCPMLTSCIASEVLELVNNVWSLFDSNKPDNNIYINFNVPDPNRCTTHNIIPLSAIAPTCQTPGVSGGQACSTCGTIIVAQIQLPTIDHVYDDVNDKDCNVCGFIRTIKCEHIYTYVSDSVAPTCTTTGRTQGETCTSCGKIIAGFEIIETTEHVYDNSRDDTCNDCGYVRKLECFHSSTNKLQEVNPTCTETGLTRGKVCVHCGEILIPQQEIPTIDHIESDWIVDKAPTNQFKGEMHTECTMCSTIIRTGVIEAINPNADNNASKGLSFALNNDQNSYSLVDIGDCTDSEIVIPKYYNGLPVTKIGEGAFLNKSHVISVIIPEGILHIGNAAFRECTSLEMVVIPNSIDTIGEYAFYNCALRSISLPDSLHKIEKYTFYNCDFTSINIPYDVVSIGEGAFAECTSIVELILPHSIETIGAKAFYNITEVLSISIPKSVTTIGDKAFNISTPDERAREFTMFNYVNQIGAYAFPTNSTIVYKGTKSEWNSILIDPRNYQYNVVALDGSFTD